MSDPKHDPRVIAARAAIEPLLRQIKQHLPEDYKLTLVCRNVGVENGQLILTEEAAEDLEAAANALLRCD